MKGKILLTLILALMGCFPVCAGVLETEGFRRVRMAEVYNPPPAQLLIMRFDDPLMDIGTAPPVWQTFLTETDSDIEKLGDIFTLSYYDIIITGDIDYVEFLGSRDLLSQSALVWRERLILARGSREQARRNGKIERAGNNEQNIGPK